ncbi:MAG: porin [Xanthobacteraceae bacterium]|nr:porin [Xanthobacteraceae bacterium]
MKILKTFFLGGAAGLVLAGGVSAADLGVKKPSPVEYVKVCNVYGSGFFYIPGSNTCLKVGGRVRFEYGYSQFKHQGFNEASTTGFRS